MIYFSHNNKQQEKEKSMKALKKYLHRYFIDAMGAMALGLFASLLIGTIFGTVGKYVTIPWLADALNTIAN
jgi:uncharacterized membrane protein